jgi:hypothetical protein
VQPIDLESLFVAIGLDRILASRPKMHIYELQRAAKLPQEIRRRLGRLIVTPEFGPAADVPAFDYQEALKTIPAGLTDKQSQALNDTIPDPELAMDLGIQARTILTWADSILPREPLPAVTKEARLGTPSHSAVADFRRVWNVAQDPMIVLDDLEDGSLAEDQVAALALLYPALYADIQQAAEDVMTAQVARRGQDWEPAPQKRAMLGVLLQKDLLDPELTAAVQQVYAQQAQQEAQAGGGGPKRSSSKSQEPPQTPGQKAAAGSQAA